MQHISIGALCTQLQKFSDENKDTNGGMPYIEIVASPNTKDGVFVSPNGIYVVVYVWGVNPAEKINITKLVISFEGVVATCSPDKSVKAPSAEYQNKYGLVVQGKQYAATSLSVLEPNTNLDGSPIEHDVYELIRKQLRDMGMIQQASGFGLTPTSKNETYAYVYVMKILTRLINAYLQKLGSALYTPNSPYINKAKEVFNGAAPVLFRGNYLGEVDGKALKSSKANIDLAYEGTGNTRKIKTVLNVRMPSQKSPSGFASSQGGTTLFKNPSQKGAMTPLTYMTLHDFLFPYNSLYSGVGRLVLVLTKTGYHLKFKVSDLVKMPSPKRAAAVFEGNADDIELTDADFEEYDANFDIPKNGSLEDSMGDLTVDPTAPPVNFTGGNQRAKSSVMASEYMNI